MDSEIVLSLKFQLTNIKKVLPLLTVVTSRNPYKFLNSDPSSQKHENPPKKDFQCIKDFPKSKHDNI